MIARKKDLSQIRKLVKNFPVTAILGARQCGKTTIAREISAAYYFDLENPRDLARFENPQLALEDLRGLVVIDEIQRKPELFPLLRYLVDADESHKYLILGSASRDLIRQSSETLAGRIAYHYLSGLGLNDVAVKNLKKLWLRGGYPRSFTSASVGDAMFWLEQYIQTFLERDLPLLGIRIEAAALRRFWTMLSHYHGQLINYTELAGSFGVSDATIRRYIDILAGTFMVRVMQPWHVNVGKRLVKRPRIYVRDSGVFHALQSIPSPEILESHPKLGASWEGFALEEVVKTLGKRDEQLFFWRTHAGAEVDLFWQHEGKNWAVEFKYSDAPNLTKNMQTAVKDLSLAHLWVVYPGRQSYRLADNITARAASDISQGWEYR